MDEKRKCSNKYTKDQLLKSIQNFVNEFNRVPISKDFNSLKGYPSRKTFTNHFGNFNDAVRMAGFNPVGMSHKDNKIRYTKDFWIENINRYHEVFNKTPLQREFDEYMGFGTTKYICDTFGGWHNLLSLCGLKTHTVMKHTDEFLESEFHRFVKEHDRIPRYKEFNNSEYPSFWCYQNRFGSWNKAVEAYGYTPNDVNRKFELEDGEICASSYEFDISNWLKDNEISYIRNVKYKDFIDGYKGKMDCDYKINYKGKTWYVEMAGFLRGTDFSKWSKEEKNYFFKLKYKRKLLKRQDVNYLIIHANDMKEKCLDDIFYFIDKTNNKI